MSDPQADAPSSRFEMHVTAESHFAWLRTRLAVERTMMAYMRTAVSLIFSVLEYRWTVRYLWSDGFAAVAGLTRKGRNTPLYAVSFVIIAVGVFAFFAVLLRML